MFFQKFIELSAQFDPYGMDNADAPEPAYGPVEDARVERYGAFNRFDNIKERNVFWFPAELETALDTPGRSRYVRLYQFLQDLCEKTFRRGHFP